MSIPLLVLLFSAGLAGCAKPVFDLTEPAAEERAAAQNTLDATRLAPSPAPGGRLDMKARLDGILPDIRDATHQVCKSLKLEEARCFEAAFAPRIPATRP